MVPYTGGLERDYSLAHRPICQKKQGLGRKMVTALFLGTVATGIGSFLYGKSNPSENLSQYLLPKVHPASMSQRSIITSFIDQYHDTIVEASKAYSVPVELIVTVICNENEGRSLFEDMKDRIGTPLGLDTSLGVGQVKQSTARRLYGKLDTLMNDSDLQRALLDPSMNLHILTKHLQQLMKGRGVIYAQAMTPEDFARIFGAYVGGEQNLHSEDIAPQGLNALLIASDFPFRRYFTGEELSEQIDPAMLLSFVRGYATENQESLAKRLSSR